MNRILLFLVLVLCLASCRPKEPVVLREVHVKELNRGSEGLILKADAILYNPNKGSMRLKGIKLDILLDGATAGQIDQKLNAPISSKAEFTIPLEVKLKMSDSGLLDTILGMFGGKKHVARFTGSIKVSVGGFPVKIPVQHEEEIKF